MSGKIVRAAAIQASPVMFDLAGTLAKSLALIKEAAASGADLVVFPELFMPGYAWWLWTSSFMSYAPRVAEYSANCPEIGGPEFTALCDLARELRVHVVMGVAEKHGSSLYIAQWIFGPDGVVGTRRKLKPTAVERVLYGEGDGSDLKVHDTSIGRLGALNCWEHLQPLIKHTMATQHEHIHASSWPTFFPDDGPVFSVGPTANTAACRVYAMEVGCFVVAASSPLTSACIAAVAGGDASVSAMLGLGGAASMIFDPLGRELASPLPHDAEGIVYATLSPVTRGLSGCLLDTVGHYSRPDVLSVNFDQRLRSVVAGAGRLRGEIYPEVEMERRRVEKETAREGQNEAKAVETDAA
ncbi:hypothetical protein CspeluHIS016_0200790 [Cutaneotrichosporon spelunceum]|uniref:CN hydrolase domain-containing protein n=1 Tax=Cutaneotrichosporon spelunceum TaxID=1672016 RepID=A0AAD3TQT3_9TREE|nr:hypothetical protein CspeluHIS016_0200790 [Cutaneotrichosporon spelunceum]